MDFKLKELFALSLLEKGRVREPSPDPREIAPFSNLEEMVAHSLKTPNLIRTQTQEGNALPSPVALKRPFEDEALLKRLLQFRDQIPTSSRVIRSSES